MLGIFDVLGLAITSLSSSTAIKDSGLFFSRLHWQVFVVFLFEALKTRKINLFVVMVSNQKLYQNKETEKNAFE